MAWRRVQAYVAGGLLALWGGWAAVNGISEASDHSKNKEQTSERQAEAHFWRTVAGDIPTTSASTENQFADDLRAIVDDPDAVREFRGDSNRYGGITEEIGYDPFDETGLNCFECGPLDSYTRARLTLIRNGDLTKITDELALKLDTQGYEFTPGGISFPMTTLIGYILIGHASYLAAGFITRPLVRSPDDRWQPNKRMLATAPAVYAVQAMQDRKATKTDRARVRSQFPQHAAVLDDVDAELADMPDGPERDDLLHAKEQVFKELDRQARRSLSTRDNGRLKDLIGQLTDVSNTLDARNEALEDLDDLDKRPRDPFIREFPGQ